MILKPFRSQEPIQIFPSIAHHPYAFILHSGLDISDQGKFSYLGCNPFLILTVKGSQLTINKNNKIFQCKTANVWPILSKLLNRYQNPHDENGPPFQGGAIGYFGYELGKFDQAGPCPDAIIAFYDHYLAYDHLEKKAWLCAIALPGENTSDMKKKIERLGELLQKKSLKDTARRQSTYNTLTSNVSKERFIDCVKKAKQYILQGDIYQVNLSQQFKTNYTGSDYTLFHHIAKINPEPFSCLFSCPESTLFLFSPESFIKITESYVQSRPIKGTNGRSTDPSEDERLAHELLHSPKDNAELLMIVDLVRNDLGKVCSYGSVRVKKLKVLEKHPFVHHLVATVEGTLKEDCDHITCIRASFPGGSITGAPKKRSMEIIEELEPDRRNTYTGAFGYIGFNQRTELAMTIRGLTRIGKELSFHVGAGIVADSIPEKEYEETLIKGKQFFQTLQ